MFFNFQQIKYGMMKYDKKEEDKKWCEPIQASNGRHVI